MNEMTLSSGYRILNSSPGGLGPNTQPPGHGGSPQYLVLHVWGRNIFVSFKPLRPGTEPRTLARKAAVLTTTLGPPPFRFSAIIYPLDLVLSFTTKLTDSKYMQAKKRQRCRLIVLY